MENNNYVPEIYIGENLNWFINGVDTGVHAQGEPGKDGITPHISEDGFWCIGDVKTAVRAKGYDGYTPFINEEGYWCTGEICSGVKAQGEKGEKGETGKTGEIGPVGPQGIKGDSGSASIADSLDVTVKGQVLDASRGRELRDSINAVNEKIVDTGYKKSYVLNIPVDTRCLVDLGVALFSIHSLSTGILVSKYASTALDTINYTIDNTKRTVTFSEKNGGNVRLTVIRA